MGCSESKNVVEPDSKKPEEKPEEKTAIVPVTFSLKFFNLGRLYSWQSPVEILTPWSNQATFYELSPANAKTTAFCSFLQKQAKSAFAGDKS